MSTKIFHLPGVPYLDYPPGNVTVIDLVLIVKLYYKVQFTLEMEMVWVYVTYHTSTLSLAPTVKDREVSRWQDQEVQYILNSLLLT